MTGPWVQQAMGAAVIAVCLAERAPVPVLASAAASVDHRGRCSANHRPAAPVLHVRLYLERGVDPLLERVARLTAECLLSDAGVPMMWSSGSQERAVPAAHDSVGIVAVVRSTRLRRTGGQSCGSAARAEDSVGGFVEVSVPCVADFAFALSRSEYGRRHVPLVMPRHDDLVGAVIAHEIAHVLGVGHTASGIMRSGLHEEELLALRVGTLAFRPPQATQLRTGLAAANGTRLAVTGK
jgi:hypothetical protein